MKNPAATNSKLLSLLTLSAGAAAFPQVAEGAVFYSGVINEQVGFSSGFNASYTIDLPGTADLQLIRSSAAAGTVPYNVQTEIKVDFKQLNGYGRIRAYNTGGANFAKRNGGGPTWDAIGGLAQSSARIGWRQHYQNGGNSQVKGPGSFTDQYIAFQFKDSTAGDSLRYGWAQMSMSVSAGGVGPDVTLRSYAFDDSGGKLQMGATAVPEPASSAAITAFCALVYGGVRRWRASKNSR